MRAPKIALSLFVIFAIAMSIVAFWPRGEVKKREVVHKQSNYIPPDAQTTSLPPISFTDVAVEAGLVFRHETGAFELDAGGPSRYLPECMGPGVIIFDPDGDEDADLFVPNGVAFPGRTTDAVATTGRYFSNEGNLKFQDRTSAVGLDFTAYGMGGSSTDVDGDGDHDLLVTTWGGPRLFMNRRETGKLRFEDVTESCGLKSDGWTNGKGQKGPDWSTSAAFFDADQDGDPDLFVCNYVKWSPESDVFASLDGKTKSYTIPDRYEGQTCRLYRNEGAGRFTDVTKESGIFDENGKALGVAVADFDGNGFLDLVVANDQQPNFLFLNQGKGRFIESALKWGIAYDENARTRAGMGIDVADYRNDGVLGVPIGNFANEPVSLYRLESKASFRDVTQQEGVAAATQLALTFGTLFADVDLDGFLDLVLANGHLEPEIQKVQKEIPYRQRPILLRNQGNGRFADWTAEAGPAFATPLVARGLAYADFDKDGDLDFVLTSNAGGIHLFRNDRQATNRYLRVVVQGRPPNTDSLGAVLVLTTGNRTQTRIVRTGSSYLSQSELAQTFGLGESYAAGKLTVTWPSGKSRILSITEGDDVTLKVLEPE